MIVQCLTSNFTTVINMTSLPTLLISFAVIGLVFSLLTRMAKRTKNLFLTFLQHFCGVWFIFSGLVKAVDPIGTAYKMEDYFAQFENTFAGLNNIFAGIAPVFPWLSAYSNGFAIFMIVLEIVLGIMLIIGFSRRLTAWLFLLIVVFFTFLTGFTYLTGFVPTEANFFDLAKWGPWVETQMRVTDCGCFGDFILLSPRTSFFKDLGLLIPSVVFLWYSKQMHQLFTRKGRNVFVGLSTVLTLLFCLQNTYMDLPVVDFRPFKTGTNIRERKALEEEARGNIEITGWVMENKNTGEIKKIMVPLERYKEVTAQCPPNEGWKVKDQIKTEPYVEKDGKRIVVKETKISNFDIEDADNNEIADQILEESGYTLMIIAYHLYGEKKTETVVVQDTTWASDTLRITADSFEVRPKVAGIAPRKVEIQTFIPEPGYGKLFGEKINPLAEAVSKAGWKVFAINTFQDAEVSESFRRKVGAGYPFYRADDKLLKTIIRSNPGIVVLKDGAVMGMYHWRHFPKPEALLGKYK